MTNDVLVKMLDDNSKFLNKVSTEIMDLIVKLGPVAVEFSTIAAKCADYSCELHDLLHGPDYVRH